MASCRLGADLFEFHERIERGCFNVFRVVHRHSGEELAMKVIEQRRDNKYAFVEREVLIAVKHPYIAPLRFAFQHESCLALLVPLCPYGDLHELVRARERLSETLSRHYLAQLVLAVGYLHDRHIIHRDLRPRTVLLDEAQQATLADFSFARPRAGAGLGRATSEVGMSGLSAPELVQRKRHGYAVDAYSLGLILHILLVGKCWPALRPHFFHSRMSRPAADFIVATSSDQPSERFIAMRQLEIQEFFDCIDFQAMLERRVPCPEPMPVPPPSEASTHARETRKEQLRRVFGRPGPRALRCFQRGLPQDWDFAADERASKNPGSSCISTACQSNWTGPGDSEEEQEGSEPSKAAS